MNLIVWGFITFSPYDFKMKVSLAGGAADLLSAVHDDYSDLHRELAFPRSVTLEASKREFLIRRGEVGAMKSLLTLNLSPYSNCCCSTSGLVTDRWQL